MDLGFSLGYHDVPDFFYRLFVDSGVRLRYIMVSHVDLSFSSRIDSPRYGNRVSSWHRDRMGRSRRFL